MAKKRERHPDYQLKQFELHKDMVSGLEEKKKASGHRYLVEFLRPYFTKIIKGEI